jgi:hypothetical protein
MAETPTLPQLHQTAFTTTNGTLAGDTLTSGIPAGGVPTVSDVPATGAGPAKRPSTTRRWTSGVTILALIIAIVANFAIIAVIASRGDSAPAIPAPRMLPPGPPALAPPGTLPPALATTFGEGRFVVGTDITPGTYRTSGKSGHKDCYWERLKDTNGGTGSIIANDLAPGPATVTIDKTDAVFQTRWCSTWTKVS